MRRYTLPLSPPLENQTDKRQTGKGGIAMTLYLKDATYLDWRDFAVSRANLAVAEGAAGGTTGLRPFRNRRPIADNRGTGVHGLRR